MYHDAHTQTHTATATAGKLGAALLVLSLAAATFFLCSGMWSAEPPPLTAAAAPITIILQPGPHLTASALQQQFIPHLQAHHKIPDTRYVIWFAETTADGRSVPAGAPVAILQTPGLQSGGSVLLPEKWQAFWSTLESVITDLLPPPAPQSAPPLPAPAPPALLGQIRAALADHARSSTASTATAQAQEHTLFIVSTLEDASVFTDSSLPTVNVPPPPADPLLLAHTRVCVWPLTPQERNPAHLKAFWNDWLQRSGATDVDWVHTAADPLLPPDRVTAIVLDASDALQEKDRQGLIDLVSTITSPAELVQLYALDPRNAGTFLTPHEVTRQDESAFRAALAAHLQALGTQQGTDQSAIIEFIQAVSADPRFSLAAARQTFADYPQKPRRQIILLTDLQENVRGSSLDLAVSPPWWRREGVWAQFTGDSHYAWAATKSSLKDIGFFVRQVRRPKETGRDIAALRTFWGGLLEDAGANIRRWDVEQ